MDLVRYEIATNKRDVLLPAEKLIPTGETKPITIQGYEHDGEALLKVKAGAAVADLNDYPVAAYNAQTSGGGKDFEVVGEQIEPGLYGIGVSKENTQLRDAVKAGVEALIANGEYAKILDKYNVKLGAVDSVTVNGGS